MHVLYILYLINFDINNRCTWEGQLVSAAIQDVMYVDTSFEIYI